MKKWFKGIVFAFVFLAGILPCRLVFADDGWGTYGDNIKWHFYEKTGTLQIEGEGAMPNGYASDMPWNSYQNSIKEVVIGEGVTHVSSNAFSKYKNLESVKLSSTVESIGDMAFNGTGIKKLVLPENIVSVGYFCFSGCNIKSLVIPGSMKSVGERAFSECKSLTSVKIENGVEVIEASCFRECAITEIVFPSSVTTIARNAFTDCDKLDHVVIPSTVTTLELGAFCNCDSLRYVVCESQGKIPQEAFSSCRSLTAVKIGGGVTSIDVLAFVASIKLSAVYIPASVTSIDDRAFKGSYDSDMYPTFYGYTDSAAYNLAGMKQNISFVDVEAVGMNKWEKVWKEAVNGGTSSSKNEKKTMEFTDLKIKKGATKITGKVSASGATVKVKIGNAAYKKAAVTKKSFSIKTSKLKQGTVVRIRVTKSGYKDLQIMTTVGQKSKIPSGAVTYNGHKYKAYNEFKTWKEAEAYCEKQNGHLVTITDQKEQDFVKKLATDAGRNVYWIGLHLNQK